MDYYGTRLATCSSDRSVKIFDVRNGGQILVADLRGEVPLTLDKASESIWVSQMWQGGLRAQIRATPGVVSREASWSRPADCLSRHPRLMDQEPIPPLPPRCPQTALG